jgi:hypothetical protein
VSEPIPLNLDVLIEGILSMHDEAPVGVKAAVEREVADIKVDFRRHDRAVTAATLRAYIEALMLGGLATVPPTHNTAASALGYRVAGACLLYRQVTQP